MPTRLFKLTLSALVTALVLVPLLAAGAPPAGGDAPKTPAQPADPGPGGEPDQSEPGQDRQAAPEQGGEAEKGEPEGGAKQPPAGAPSAPPAPDPEQEQEALRLFALAKDALKEGQPADALPLLDQAYAIYPHPFVIYYLAQVHASLGDRATSCYYWRSLDGAIERKRVEVQMEIADCEMNNARPDAALARLDAIAMKVGRAVVLRFQILRSDALIRLGKVSEAEDLLGTVLGRKMGEDLEARANAVLRKIEIQQYGFPLDTAERREAASLVDNARARRREQRYGSAVRFVRNSMEKHGHERTRLLFAEIVREWLAQVGGQPPEAKARGQLALAAALEGADVQEDLAGELARALVASARERLQAQQRDPASRLARAALRYADLADAREVLIRTASTQERIYVPAGLVNVGTPAAEIGTLVATCEREIRNPARCRPVRFRAEAEQRKVRVSPFHISRTEVTVAQFRRCVEAGVCTREHFDVSEPCPFSMRGREDHPMACVDWEGAQQYCRYADGRLPTEAEWEVATAGRDARAYPWGKNRPDGTLANLADRTAGREGTAYPFDNELNDGYARSAPVGSFPRGATPTGVLDLTGNVSEWCLDWYRPLPVPSAGEPPEDPRGPCDAAEPCEQFDRRVIRGGSYSSMPIEARARAREGVPPAKVLSWLGFRCVWPESYQ